MIELKKITNFLDQELDIDSYRDASLNGLQFEGSPRVAKVAVAVDAGLSVIKEAIDLHAQLLIVHHGVFWGKESPITGSKKTLFKTLLDSHLTLYAAHLPLDAHMSYGNNFCLARYLDLSDLSRCAEIDGQFIGCRGLNKKNHSLVQIKEILSELPGANKEIFSLDFGPKTPKKVAIVSGAGASEMRNFESEDFDTFITGEPKQSAFHFAKENNLNAIFAGHYATETLGVQELGKLLHKEFGLNYKFIDQPTGI